MKQILHPDSRLMHVLSLASSLMILNLIWFASCIPVVTIGPSFTALYGVTKKIIHGEEPVIFKTFFRIFKQEFKRTILISAILVIPLIIAAWFVFLSAYGKLDGSGWFKVLCYISIAIISVIYSYVWPLTAWFENSVGSTIRNAMLIPLSHPFAALAVTVLNFTPLILLRVNSAFFLQSGIIWILIGGALIAHINTRILESQFQQYM